MKQFKIEIVQRFCLGLSIGTKGTDLGLFFFLITFTYPTRVKPVLKWV